MISRYAKTLIELLLDKAICWSIRLRWFVIVIKPAMLFPQRYSNDVICVPHRQPYRATIESDVETTPREESKLPRSAKTTVTWRWCAPPACHLAYSTRLEPAKCFYEKACSEEIAISREITISHLDRPSYEARNWKSHQTCDS